MSRAVDINGRGVRVKGRGVGVGSAIPDTDIYLHDDWGDNKLQNRDGSGTTTYNGVTGYYRPEWTLDAGSPIADNQNLVLQAGSTGGDQLYADINLDLGEIITWEWKGIEFDIVAADVNQIIGLGLWADGTNFNAGRPDDGYLVTLRGGGSHIRLYDPGVNNVLVEQTSGFPSSPFDIKVTRDPTVAGDPEYEMFVAGTSQGIATSPTSNDPASVDYHAIGQRQDTDPCKINEIKVE